MTPRSPRPELSQLSHAQKDALIYALLDRIDALVAEVSALKARVAELEAKLNEPPKTPDNSSTPPSKGQKANRDAKEKRKGPRAGSVGRKGGGRALTMEPDQFVSAKAASCRHCGTALATMSCTGATTRSTCRRFVPWSHAWSAIRGTAAAAAG